MADPGTTVRWMAAAGLVLAASAPAAAQTISPGMTTAQVRSLLGEPATVRTTGDWSYLYYLNGCAVRCGSDDVVFVQNGRVVTAVFRTARRRIAGGPASAVLERTAGAQTDGAAGSDASGGMVRLDESAAAPTQMRPRSGAREEPGRTVIGRPGARPPARVGGVRVDGEAAGSRGGRATIIRREDDDAGDARRGSGDEAGRDSEGPLTRTGSVQGGRVNDTRPEERGVLTRTGIDSPANDAAAVDSSGGAPATAVDDIRRAREDRIERNTVRSPGNTPAATADSTLNRNRLERERTVTPRTVTRP